LGASEGVPDIGVQGAGALSALGGFTELFRRDPIFSTTRFTLDDHAPIVIHEHLPPPSIGADFSSSSWLNSLQSLINTKSEYRNPKQLRIINNKKQTHYHRYIYG